MNYTKPEVVLANAAAVIKNSTRKGDIFADANQVDSLATAPGYEADE